jgi:hypothetical protein
LLVCLNTTEKDQYNTRGSQPQSGRYRKFYYFAIDRTTAKRQFPGHAEADIFTRMCYDKKQDAETVLKVKGETHVPCRSHAGNRPETA